MKLIILGATGAVGLELIKLLDQRNFPLTELVLLASSRSAGRKLVFRNREYEVKEVSRDAFKEGDVAVFSAGSEASRNWAPIAVEEGCTVIDNSSAWRMDENIPLIVPEINMGEIGDNFGPGIIANPNCSTIQLVLPLKVLDELFKLKEVFVSTYQSVSGTGSRAIAELDSQARAYAAGGEIIPGEYEKRIIFNCLPVIGNLTETGSSTEEDKMLNETRKILNLPDLNVYATAVRVPVFRGHAEAVTVRLCREPDTIDVIQGFKKFPGIRVITDDYPTQAECVEQESVYLGRVRKEKSDPNVISLWIVSDNLWKGAALNAIQIAEQFIKGV